MLFLITDELTFMSPKITLLEISELLAPPPNCIELIILSRIDKFETPKPNIPRIKHLEML